MLRTKKNGGITVLYPRKVRSAQSVGRVTSARAIRTHAVLDYHAQKVGKTRKRGSSCIQLMNILKHSQSSRSRKMTESSTRDRDTTASPNTAAAQEGPMHLSHPRYPSEMEGTAMQSKPAHQHRDMLAEPTLQYTFDRRGPQPPSPSTAAPTQAHPSVDPLHTFSYNHVLPYQQNAPSTSFQAPSQYSGDHHVPAAQPQPPATSQEGSSRYTIDGRHSQVHHQSASTAMSVHTVPGSHGVRSYPQQPPVTSANGPGQCALDEQQGQRYPQSLSMTSTLTPAQSYDGYGRMHAQTYAPSYQQPQVPFRSGQRSGYDIVPHPVAPEDSYRPVNGDSTRVASGADSNWQQVRFTLDIDSMTDTVLVARQ